jgi:S1-C subfamily serine protease
VRASIGIVYSFGRRSMPAPPASTPRSIRSEAPVSGGIKIAAIGAIVTLGRNAGAEITDLAPNGPGAIAGLHVGDVINAVDGKPIQTPTELAAELSSHGDKVRLGYLLRGNWQSEAVIVLVH